MKRKFEWVNLASGLWAIGCGIYNVVVFNPDLEFAQVTAIAIGVLFVLGVLNLYLVIRIRFERWLRLWWSTCQCGHRKEDHIGHARIMGRTVDGWDRIVQDNARCAVFTNLRSIEDMEWSSSFGFRARGDFDQCPCEGFKRRLFRFGKRPGGSDRSVGTGASA
ncbi:hypothetical protein SEA_JEGGS_93 [Arthrobacter phage JEGGS]|uniref:Uncharacterized protein n=2 Tax=Mudcatvirus TaxID=1982088 RepID=A0A222Z8Q2_9CAUD|nr:hypothetical protein PQB79_gp093 [Arthrobacter phage Heisenberger]YP_010666672.1 hypothetical protein PQB80_gp093 [Arthrobacter phage JEGGS]ASR80347.1 hypothetical protein SEA_HEISENBERGER_93 [Arthrobacter phage Heisenberger]QDM57576.1 hypothetical protein SEA_JEGGS_93 [Arthrobacter phage JEGGS]